MKDSSTSSYHTARESPGMESPTWKQTIRTYAARLSGSARSAKKHDGSSLRLSASRRNVEKTMARVLQSQQKYPLKFVTSLESNGVNHSEISLWRWKDHLFFGKTVDLRDDTIDPPMFEAWNAILLEEIQRKEMQDPTISFLHTMRYIKTQPSTRGQHYRVVVYSHEGKAFHIGIPSFTISFTKFLAGWKKLGQKYGVSHNDLHEQNVMWNEQHQLSIIDFGRMYIHHRSPNEEVWVGLLTNAFGTPKKYYHDFTQTRTLGFQVYNPHAYIYDIMSLCMGVYARLYHRASEKHRTSFPVQWKVPSMEITHMDSTRVFGDSSSTVLEIQVLRAVEEGVRTFMQYHQFFDAMYFEPVSSEEEDPVKLKYGLHAAFQVTENAHRLHYARTMIPNKHPPAKFPSLAAPFAKSRRRILEIQTILYDTFHVAPMYPTKVVQRYTMTSLSIHVLHQLLAHPEWFPTTPVMDPAELLEMTPFLCIQAAAFILGEQTRYGSFVYRKLLPGNTLAERTKKLAWGDLWVQHILQKLDPWNLPPTHLEVLDKLLFEKIQQGASVTSSQQEEIHQLINKLLFHPTAPYESSPSKLARLCIDTVITRDGTDRYWSDLYPMIPASLAPLPTTHLPGRTKKEPRPMREKKLTRRKVNTKGTARRHGNPSWEELQAFWKPDSV